MNTIDANPKPQPRIGIVDRPFWQGCNEGKLLIQQCGACRRHVFYPRVCCPYCRAGELAWVQASGRGRVVSHTTVRRTHHDGFNAQAPYVFAAVELDEGALMYAHLVGAPTDGVLLMGRPVRVCFEAHGRGSDGLTQKIAAFHLDEGSQP